MVYLLNKVFLFFFSVKRIILELLHLKYTLISVSEYKSPVAKYLKSNVIKSYTGAYDLWRTKRINKIIEILGVDYFQGKRVLELGSGYGEMGAFFAEIGAEVLCVEGRMENVNISKLLYKDIPNLNVKCFNLEKDFTSLGHFDLIIHMGLLQHIQDVELHLKRCSQCSDNIILEAGVIDSKNDDFFKIITEDAGNTNNSIIGYGNHFSPSYIEEKFRKMRFSLKRYDDNNLNIPYTHVYDWKIKNTNKSYSLNGEFRRFWWFYKKNN